MILVACSKDKLPKASEDGKNTFGCKIDGNNFIPSEATPSLSGPSRPLIVSNSELDGFGVYALNFSSEPHNSVSIRLPRLRTTGVYPLNTFGYGEYKLEYSFGPIYRTNVSSTGSVTITRCDTINKIYSGTFSFEGIDPNTGAMIKVTDGRFDVKRN